MPRFAYKAYDSKGIASAGTVDCSDRDAAYELLRKRGQHPVSLTEDASKYADPWWQRDIFQKSGLSVEDVSVFTREIAALMRADLPLDEALAIIQLRRGLPARVLNFTARVQSSVREGQSFSRALAAEAPSVPEYYWRLIAVGEASGSMSEVVSDLAAYLERSSAVRQRISSALAYPVLLLAAAGMAVAIVTLVLIPAITPLFTDAGVPLPPLLRFLSSLQSALSNHWLITLVLIACVLSLIRSLRHSQHYRLFLDRGALRLPLIGDLVKTRETARFTRILGTLLRNGVSVVDALRASTRPLDNTAVKAGIDAAAARVEEGGSLSQELAASGHLTELALRLVSVGERTAQLDAILLKAADLHEDDFQRRIDRTIQYLGPILTLMIGGFAGGLILMVLNAILSINDLALR